MKEAVDKKNIGRVEYRPCIVHVPAKVSQDVDFVGTCVKYGTMKTEKEEEFLKALFHCWDFRSELYGASPLIGGHSAGQVSRTFGIVEYEDGTIHEVEPTQIRFVDREIKNYAFCIDEKEVE